MIYPDTITVSVTHHDIQHGARASCYFCPIAMAVRRAMPNTMLHVNSQRIRLGGKHDYPLPKSAKAFIVRFDGRNRVSPFTFKAKRTEEAIEKMRKEGR